MISTFPHDSPLTMEWAPPKARSKKQRSVAILSIAFALFLLIFLFTCFVSPVSKFVLMRFRWVALAGIFALFALMRRNAVRSFPFMLSLFYFVCLLSSSRAEGYAFSLAKLLPATLSLLLMFYLIPAALDPRQYKRLLAVVCGLLCCMGLASLSFGIATGRIFALRRYEALFLGPNSEGVYMGFVFFSALWLWATYPTSKYRLVFQFLVPASLVACYGTSSRSSFFGLLAGIIVWGITLLVRGQSKRRRQFIIVGIMLSGAFMAKRSFFQEGWELMMRKAESSEEFFESRMWIWEDSWRAFKKRPFLGHGYGVSALVGDEKKIKLGFSASVRDGSGYLGMLESVGIIGCTAFGLLVLQLVLYEIHLLRRRLTDEHALTAHGMSAMTAFLLLNHIGEPWLLGPGNPTFQLFWFFMAAAFHFNYLARAEDRRRRRELMRARLLRLQEAWAEQQSHHLSPHAAEAPIPGRA